MSKLLIDSVKLVEKWKLATPLMERILIHGGFCYFAGSLMLKMEDPITHAVITDINILPIDDHASEIIRKGQYLASQIYVKHKAPTCCFQTLAKENIEKYEKVIA